MFHFDYLTEGTCSKLISFDLEEDRVHNIAFAGGCPGNLLALSVLLEGATTDEIVGKLQGLLCGKRATSCGDQLTKAVMAAQVAKNDPNYVSPLELDD